MTLESHAVYAVACAILGTLIVVMACIASHRQAPTVKPYSYATTVTHNGRLMACTMDVDSSGNGSLNNCRSAS